MILDLNVTVKLPPCLLRLFHSYLQLEVHQNLDTENVNFIRIRHRRKEQKELPNSHIMKRKSETGYPRAKLSLGSCTQKRTLSKYCTAKSKRVIRDFCFFASRRLSKAVKWNTLSKLHIYTSLLSLFEMPVVYNFTNCL